MTDDLTRPIIGIENRTAQEAFDIMCDRIEQERLARKSPSPQPHTGRAGPPLTIVDTNWRGETAERRIVPMYLWHGATEWHPEPQWLLKAIDADKGEERDFAWNGIDFQGDGPANAALTVELVAPTKDEIRNEIARREEAGVDARVPLTGPAKFKGWSDADLRSAIAP